MKQPLPLSNAKTFQSCAGIDATLRARGFSEKMGICLPQPMRQDEKTETHFSAERFGVALMTNMRQFGRQSPGRSLKLQQAVNKRIRAICDGLGERSVVLVGLMGAGKSTVGRRLATRLDLPFLDADAEIEAAAGMTIPEIFATHGEAYFREGEKRVIARILQEGPLVLATGGGAYMNEETRHAIAASGVSIWLKADVDVLLERVSRRRNRPLLANVDPRATLERLMQERYPVYALADIEIQSRDAPHDRIVAAVIRSLRRHLDQQEKAST